MGIGDGRESATSGRLPAWLHYAKTLPETETGRRLRSVLWDPRQTQRLPKFGKAIHLS